MHTTQQLVELAKQRLAEKHGLSLPMSDYRFEKLSGFSQSNISRWVNGKSTIGTEFAARFADLTGLSAAYVLASTQHERTADPSVRQILTTIAAAFKETKAAGWIVAAMVAAGMSFAPAGNQAHASALNAQPATYYAPMRRRRSAGFRAWLRFFTVFPVAVLATACANLAPLAEYQHLSHATQHFGDNRTNYGYDVVSAGVRWRPAAGVTVDLLEGYSLQEMHGRREVFSGRITVEFGGAQ